MFERELAVYDVDKNTTRNFHFAEPHECPLCHHALRPDMKVGNFIWNHQAGPYTIYVPCFCPHCRDMFFAKYTGQFSNGSFSKPALKNFFPVNFRSAEFSEGISGLSPTFVETYNQSLSAESQDLTEICGMGYRKALEYLVKDYLIHLNPDQEEVVKKELLGASIQRIDSRQIKTLAERSTWIGNDETHYVRKHENLDYSDMKRFINALVRYIDSELTFEEALSIESKK